MGNLKKNLKLYNVCLFFLIPESSDLFTPFSTELS